MLIMLDEKAIESLIKNDSEAVLAIKTSVIEKACGLFIKSITTKEVKDLLQPSNYWGNSSPDRKGLLIQLIEPIVNELLRSDKVKQLLSELINKILKDVVEDEVKRIINLKKLLSE